MPLNTLRLNHRPSTHPNDRIVFIKPLPRPASEQQAYETADLLLRAIAAQCLPIMKSHYLSVTTLEEYEPNREFIGRNFNNGEVIQLVLKSRSGNWLPINFIQMVMMHELAHNMHMNHGKGFWATRNKFAEEMRGLWAKGYTGDGLWGSGRTVGDLGRVMGGNVVRSEELKDLPLCGGTFRSRGRKRKRKDGSGGDELSWKQKRDRRIEKKFGKNGQSLGEDEDKRLRLEMEGKGPVGVKPRVAQSKRGRELRAAAALARFGSNKKELEALEAIKKEEEDELANDAEDSEYEDGDDDLEDVKGADGVRLLDSNGRGMVRVCGEEQEDDVEVKREVDELEGLGFDPTPFSEQSPSPSMTNDTESTSLPTKVKHEPARKKPPHQLSKIPQHNHNLPPTPPAEPSIRQNRQPSTNTQKATRDSHRTSSEHTVAPIPQSDPIQVAAAAAAATTTSPISCPICSMSNSRLNPTCLACSHVLDPKKDPKHWACKSEMCRGSSSPQYLNAGDCGICGVCSARRQ